MKIWIKYKFKD